MRAYIGPISAALLGIVVLTVVWRAWPTQTGSGVGVADLQAVQEVENWCEGRALSCQGLEIVRRPDPAAGRLEFEVAIDSADMTVRVYLAPDGDTQIHEMERIEPK
jgi:hypothetical protein